MTTHGKNRRPDAREPGPATGPGTRGVRQVVETLQARTRGRERLVNQGIAWTLLAFIAVAAGLALSPGLFSQRIPYEDRDLGAIATGTVKANRDYDIPDEETTRRMRDEAVAAVRAVYVHDAAALEVTLRRIHDGFHWVRLYARSAGDDGAADEAGKARKKREIRTEEQLRELLARYEPARGEFERRLETRLDDAEFRLLAEHEFSEEIETAVAGLVSKAMREMVVADREEMAQHRDRGIAIRRVGAGGPAEEILSEVGGIRDLAKVRAAVEEEAFGLADFPPAVRRVVGSLARREIRSNLQFDPDLTRKRREDAATAIKPVVIQLKKGEKIIGDGERIGARHLLIFRWMRQQAQAADLVQVRVGGALFAALLVAVIWLYARASFPRFRPSRKDALVLASWLVFMLFLANLFAAVADAVRDRTPEIPLEAFYFAIPFAAGAMLIRFVLSGEAALLFAVAFAGLVGVLMGDSLVFAVFALAGGVVAALKVSSARDRGGLFRAGAVAGLVQAALVVVFALFEGKVASWDVVVSLVAAFLGGAVATPVLLMAVSPVMESLLGYTTDIKLLELANLNHPALKELIVQAPGTYHHSIIVGTLVEGAAEAIGANPLLAKVCAYYHDLGKGKNPLYFSENQKGENRHDSLPPEESARIILQHVEAGLEIARKYQLPKQVADAIPEHHGTRLVGFFYHKALKAQAAREEPAPVDPAPFRYPGPKPRSRESALVMMADAVEAASRAVPDAGPAALRELVRKLIHGIFADGQLDDCDLTLRDLGAIAKSFCRTLEGIYHSRPDYPAAAKGSEAQLVAPAAGDEEPAAAAANDDEAKRFLN